jgi:hypothetical protein
MLNTKWSRLRPFSAPSLVSTPSIFDCDSDGQTNFSDFAELRKRFGITLWP